LSVHAGLGLSLAMSVLGQVGIHGSSGGGGSGILLGAHADVVEHGSSRGRFVLKPLGKRVGFVGVVGGQLCCSLARGTTACRGGRLCHLARTTSL
jgi:hypothetical protein